MNDTDAIVIGTMAGRSVSTSEVSAHTTLPLVTSVVMLSGSQVGLGQAVNLETTPTRDPDPLENEGTHPPPPHF